MVDAVHKLMREELSDGAHKRWCALLNTELGETVFLPSGTTLEQPLTAPLVWVPAKPKLALALLDAFMCAQDAAPKKKSVGKGVGPLSKLLLRCAVERVRLDKGTEWLKACGELTTDQLESPTRLNQTLSRVAFDLMVYVHARAVELQHEQGVSALLLMHSSDQTIVGREMRGCGAVYCEAGKAIFANAVALVRDAFLRDAKLPGESQ